MTDLISNYRDEGPAGFQYRTRLYQRLKQLNTDIQTFYTKSRGKFIGGLMIFTCRRRHQGRQNDWLCDSSRSE